MRTAVRCSIWLVAASVLCGCAAVQVDVDVYKGPFAHEKEIQVKQYATLAAAAKPFLVELHDGAWDRHRLPEETGRSTDDRKKRCRLPTLLPEERFYCEILALYSKSEPDNPGFEGNRSSQSKLDDKSTPGIDDLTQDVTNAFQTRSPEAAPRQEAAVALLNEALIFFAQKVLFTVNNQQLFGDSTSSSEDKKRREKTDTARAVLQSLGNTILVHANDLQRRTAHDKQLRESAGAEGKAMVAAFRLTPSAAFDSIIGQLHTQNLPVASGAGAPTPTSQPAAAPGPDLDNEKKILAQLIADAGAFGSQIAPLVAAHRTIVGESAALSRNDAINREDISSADLDRKAIAKLYPGEPFTEAQLTEATPLKALEEWLEREGSDTVAVSPQRPTRLNEAKLYLVNEKARLESNGGAALESRSLFLDSVRANIKDKAGLAIQRRAQLAEAIRKQEGVVRTASAQATRAVRANELATRRQEDAKKHAGLVSDRESVIAIVESVRRDVVEKSEAARVTGEAGVRSLLKIKLAAMTPAPGAGRPNAADLALARSAIDGLSPDPTAPCQAGEKECSSHTSLKVIDNLIASLRAQRVRALAAGDSRTAANIMAAIEATYSQRTSMIYLRPASDYLRSVYSSSAFQASTDKQDRNMLTDWFKENLNPFERESTSVQQELEKIYWQSVNKVTVSGGGKTNYVIAKDDVGNWYVKAYSSDPESVIKSATSLAMFSAGKGMNVNLLRRMELQRQLDDDRSLSSSRRSEIRKELAENNGQTNIPLLKVRDRYATRYAGDTAQQLVGMHEGLTSLPAKVRSAAREKSDAGDACKLDAFTEGLAALDKAYLEPAREKAAKAIPVDPSADAGKPGATQVRDAEKAIQAGLTAMHLYASAVYRGLSESTAEDCTAHQRTAAARARGVIRAQLLGAASERKLSIERYEDALSSIADIATEN